MAKMEKEAKDDPFTKEVIKKFKEALDDFDKDWEKQWESMEEHNPEEIDEMESDFKDAIDEAKKDGVDWSKVKLDRVSFDKKDMSVEGFEKGDLVLIISHDGKKYELEVDCFKVDGYGWFIGGDVPKWRGEE